MKFFYSQNLELVHLFVSLKLKNLRSSKVEELVGTIEAKRLQVKEVHKYTINLFYKFQNYNEQKLFNK
jgi:hypothetical protein